MRETSLLAAFDGGVLTLTLKLVQGVAVAVVAQYKRVLNAVGLERFDRTIEAEPDATRRLMAGK